MRATKQEADAMIFRYGLVSVLARSATCVRHDPHHRIREPMSGLEVDDVSNADEDEENS